MICTGNICRSPIAEVVVRHLVQADPSIDGQVEVTSAGTANWHVGKPMDDRARRALDRAGFTGAGTLGQFASGDYLDQQDIVVVMTREHLVDVKKRLSNPGTDVILLRNLLEPGLNLDVHDPYYDGDEAFDECLALVTQAAQLLTSEFRQRLDVA